MNDASRQQVAQRFGRRIGIAVFTAIVASFVLVCSSQILYQGFRAPRGEASADCRQGIHQLISEIRKARAAAAEEVLGERAAMRKFRSKVSLNGGMQKSLQRQCEADSWSRDALQAVDEWRWAEENAVRYESVDLAPSRRKIQAIELQLGLNAPKAVLPVPRMADTSFRN